MPMHPLSTQSPRELQLIAEFGELLSTADLARLLHYPSSQAVRKARARGTLNLPMQRISGRRGWFVTTRVVAAYLDALDVTLKDIEEVPIQPL
jgi:hypothetical protein